MTDLIVGALIGALAVGGLMFIEWATRRDWSE